MAELLLLNPRARTKKRKARKAPSAAQRRARAAFAAASRSRRRRNPVAAAPAAARRRRAPSRRSNPMSTSVRRATRRRRNPISLGGGGSSYMAMFKSALVQGAGAVAMDVAFGQINKFLPALLQRVAGTVGVGDAVKAGLTVLIGKVLAKPTKGLSMRAAAGSLTVQVRDIMATFVPSSLPLGYYTAGRVVNGSARIGPNTRGGVGAYIAPGATPLLNGMGAYMAPGVSPLLNGRGNAFQREGVSRYR